MQHPTYSFNMLYLIKRILLNNPSMVVPTVFTALASPVQHEHGAALAAAPPAAPRPPPPLRVAHHGVGAPVATAAPEATAPSAAGGTPGLVRSEGHFNTYESSGYSSYSPRA